MEGLIEGRIVHFVIESGSGQIHHRPAIVVHVWRDPDGTPPANGNCNLQVFTDSNESGQFNDALPPVMWKTSVLFDENARPGTWHWPEKA